MLFTKQMLLMIHQTLLGLIYILSRYLRTTLAICYVSNAHFLVVISRDVNELNPGQSDMVYRETDPV